MPVYALSFEDFASWLSDFFRITGYQVYENQTTKPTCPYECCMPGGVYEAKSCEYPKICDGYKCASIETTTTTTPAAICAEASRKCLGSAIAECISGNWVIVTTDCKYGCTNGYCNSEPAPIPEQTTTTAEVTTTVSIVKEQVKCVFTDTASEQKCYGGDGKFGCYGLGSCIADVVGGMGTKIVWKSSCPNVGYVETTIDGSTKYAAFKCAVQAATQIVAATTPVSSVKEQVKCVFANSVSDQKCFNEYGQACGGTGTCVVDVSGEKGRMLTWKSTCGGGYAYTMMDGVNEYAEFNCQQNQLQTQTTNQTIPISTAIQTSQPVKEQVQCRFLDSDVLLNPHTAIPEKCYSDRFGCLWDGNVATEESGKKYAYCVAGEVVGYMGTKLTWKSSCGGYAYTVMDGNNENIEFQCVPSSNVTTQQIIGKGFKYAYAQCYDGAEQKILPPEGVLPCQPAEFYQQRATNFCKDHCYADGSKCGVNSFSISGECYVDVAAAGTVFIPPEQVEEVGKEKISMPPDSKVGDLLLVLFYKDNCPYCSGMGEEVDKVSSQLGIKVMKINADEKPSLAMGYGVSGFPSFILLEYASDGIKEYAISGKTDSSTLIEWINKIKSHKAVPTEKLKEEIPLICKDACPSEGKCYPFGYRKEGKYCSDIGAFVDQLKEEAACENNFECTTNVCVDGKCISSNLLQSIMDFFKNLFGLK